MPKKSPSHARLHAIVRGRVQGVFFRAWTQEQAHALRLSGWVRNNYDGSVELIAEGPRAFLEDFLKKCWEGPSAAWVEKVESEWLVADGTFEGFQVRH